MRSPGALAIDSVGSIGTLTNSGQIVGAVDLLGGSGDTLELGPGAFGGHAAFSRSMSQVGSDTVIRLGATDSITLNDVRLSTLGSVDFKVV